MESSGAFAEAVVFLDHFEDLADPRQRGKVVYPLDEVLLLCLLAVLAGADSIVDIARFGDKKRDLLRRFRPFSDGTPSHDQLGTILAILDARMFQQCFVAWVATITGVPGEVIAIDGKTSRRSYRSRPGQLHHHQAHGTKPHTTRPRQGLLRLRRKVAAWDDDFRASLITQ